MKHAMSLFYSLFTLGVKYFGNVSRSNHFLISSYNDTMLRICVVSYQGISAVNFQSAGHG